MTHARRGTIVVLEENPAALDLIEQTLRGAGHRVLATRDPMEVVEVVERIRIDLFVAALGRFRPEQQAVLAQLCLPQPGCAFSSSPTRTATTLRTAR